MDEGGIKRSKIIKIYGNSIPLRNKNVYFFDSESSVPVQSILHWDVVGCIILTEVR